MRQTLVEIGTQVRPHIVRWVTNNVGISYKLCGACGIASYALWKVLEARGIEADLVCLGGIDEGYHCWVEVKSWVVDITATQFGGPEVAVFRASKPPQWAYGIDHGPRKVNAAAVKELSKWEEHRPQPYLRRISYLVSKLGTKV